ncbi:MAG: hypothetical protein KAS32_21205 [Candidatus Peribacteraceae bacterium]|nr:hypothetical protein [Candidatus Peribacteraceae bacterium]
MSKYHAFNQNITAVSRMSYTGNKSSRANTGDTFDCSLQPLDDQTGQIQGIQFGQGYRVYVQLDADILVGDILTIDGDEYTVRGKQAWNHNYHKFLKLIVELPKNG